MLTIDFSVYHQLGINDIYCVLKYREIPLGDTRLDRWDIFHGPIDSQGSLRPDGYFEIQSSQKTVPAFLEFDLAHENLLIWKVKLHKYLRYAVSGEFERGFHQPQFRVIVVTDSERRREALRRSTAAVTDKIFWFTTTDSIHRDGFWSPIWFRPRGDHKPVSLS
jgi:protein involved in plasmid replication-relaxation